MRLLSSAPFAALAIVAIAAPPTERTERPRNSGPSAAAAAWQRHAAQAHAALATLNQPDGSGLPAPPAGVAALAFADFFGPIGDRGLDYSPKLRALDGRPVRLVGYMVREQEHAPGLFLLAGWPLNVETKGGCATDPVPATAVHVVVPSSASRPVPYRPGRIVLFGRIEIGPRPAADGRVSTVRLVLDAASAASIVPSAEVSAP